MRPQGNPPHMNGSIVLPTPKSNPSGNYVVKPTYGTVQTPTQSVGPRLNSANKQKGSTVITAQPIQSSGRTNSISKSGTGTNQQQMSIKQTGSYMLSQSQIIRQNNGYVNTPSNGYVSTQNNVQSNVQSNGQRIPQNISNSIRLQGNDMDFSKKSGVSNYDFTNPNQIYYAQQKYHYNTINQSNQVSKDSHYSNYYVEGLSDSKSSNRSNNNNFIIQQNNVPITPNVDYTNQQNVMAQSNRTKKSHCSNLQVSAKLSNSSSIGPNWQQAQQNDPYINQSNNHGDAAYVVHYDNADGGFTNQQNIMVQSNKTKKSHYSNYHDASSSQFDDQFDDQQNEQQSNQPSHPITNPISNPVSNPITNPTNQTPLTKSNILKANPNITSSGSIGCACPD